MARGAAWGWLVNASEVGRLRAALDQAEADVPHPGGDVSRVELERHFASRNWANAYRLAEAGLGEAAETYRDAARRHGQHAQRLAQEAAEDATVWVKLPDGYERVATERERQGAPLPEGARLVTEEEVTSRTKAHRIEREECS